MSSMIATGYDFEPMADGNVLVEFYGADGVTFNTQIISPGLMRNMAVVAALTDAALRKGPEVAGAIMKLLSSD